MSTWQHFALPIVAEIAFLAAAIYCVYRAQKNRIYPAFWQFLVFQAASQVVLLVGPFAAHIHLLSGVHAYEVYFFTYWPCFLISSVLMLRIMHEMFRHAVRSIPGVQKMGRPIFFWAVVVSAVLACASGTTAHQSGVSLLLASSQIVARSESVLALCLLTFLAFASRTLGVPFGSRIFGVTFGLGLMATGTLVNAAILTRIPSLASGTNFALELVNLASISIWCVYFLHPEPARRLITVPSTSPLMRWNEIAQSLGNPAGQVAVSYPPSFMTGVLDLVKNVMGPDGWPVETVSSSPPGPIAS